MILMVERRHPAIQDADIFGGKIWENRDILGLTYKYFHNFRDF